MSSELIWKIGGAQGEGIDSSGEILSQVLNRMGYYVFGYRHFMSLIKGGHTYYKVRVGARQRLYQGDGLDVLLALDQYTIDYNAHELHDGSVVIYDSTRFEAKLPAGPPVHACPVPLTKIAKELGGEIMKNTVAIGASAAILGLSTEDFASVIEDRFGGKKGTEIVKRNMDALAAGYAYAREHFLSGLDEAAVGRLGLDPIGQRDPTSGRKPPRRMYISGNDLSAMGSLVAGCRFLAAYPITPATDIMYWMIKHLPEVGGAAIQAEDEIAALNMAIGGGYAGVRSMTSSSGPGLSLMSEALGFAGIGEIPVVIVDVMRSGPGTGLPTKTEQSDLNHLLYTGHGEAPRIVLAARDMADCFYVMGDAFNLAEQYQCPVIVATDLFLGMSKQSLDPLDFQRIQIDRGQVLTAEQLQDIERGAYKRYAVTESGISPRSIPGVPKGEYTALTNEHDEQGREEVEDQYSRVTQMQKRFRKLDSLDLSHRVTYDGPEQPDVLLVGWGSTGAQIGESVERLRSEGVSVAHLQVGALLPLPTAAIAPALAAAKKVVVVEHTFKGQFAALLRQEIGYHDKISTCLKYNGDPFTLDDIARSVREVLAAPMAVSVTIASTGLGGAPDRLEVK